MSHLHPLQIRDDKPSSKHPYHLEVRGHIDGVLLFSNSTQLRFDLRGFSSFIQTDRARYLPGQMVKIRVVSIQPNGRPVFSPVDVLVRVRRTAESEPF